MRGSAVTCIVRLGSKDTRLQLYRRHPRPDARCPCRGPAPGGPGPASGRPIPPTRSRPPTHTAACAISSAHTAAQCAATAASSNIPTAGGSVATQCAPPLPTKVPRSVPLLVTLLSPPPRPKPPPPKASPAQARPPAS